MRSVSDFSAPRRCLNYDSQYMNYNLDEVYESATQRITERRPLIVISGNFGEPAVRSARLL